MRPGEPVSRDSQTMNEYNLCTFLPCNKVFTPASHSSCNVISSVIIFLCNNSKCTLYMICIYIYYFQECIYIYYFQVQVCIFLYYSLHQTLCTFIGGIVNALGLLMSHDTGSVYICVASAFTLPRGTRYTLL